MWGCSSDVIVLNVLNNEVDLDCECWSCDGGKSEPHEIHTSEEDGSCTNCDGVGYELTRAGQAIMDLVKRHGVK